MFCRQFSEWLLVRYGSEDALIDAWGPAALNAYPDFQAFESLDEGTIFPIAHAYYYTPEALEGAKKDGVYQRLLDTAEFLYWTQNNFYRKFENAIREAGYEGPLVASCWQAASGAPHYYNLHSDAQIGIIDRHNYFGGGTGWEFKPGPVKNTPMVSEPGSGLLSTGMQQVANRPFTLSEWMSLIPNEWTAEASPLIAMYGMGLQGWDASYAFAMNLPGYSTTIHTHGPYNVNSPTQMGLYPALARMLYRGDLQEADIVSSRAVQLDSLAKGKIGFKENVEQDRDEKSLSGEVPQAALAEGRVVVEFTETPRPLTVPALTADSVITAVTGELDWNIQGRGFYTINTAGTQGVVGFAKGRKLEFYDFTVETSNDFAVILITSLEKDKSISEADRILVTTIARARNTGMEYNEDHSQLNVVGTAPIQLEPVDVTLRSRQASFRVRVLDHAGRSLGSPFPPAKILHLDGGRTQTLYYELERAR